MAVTVVEVSLTEMPEFERLVQFLRDAEDLARVNADDELATLVDQTRTDLLEMH